MKTQKGFTLIELIIVIVVLGILAVTAAPQFINFSTDARESALKGLEGAIKGANQVVYAKANIENVADDDYDSGTSTYPMVDGIETVYGYPAGTSAGIAAAANASTADWGIYYETASDTPATAPDISVRLTPIGVNEDTDNDGVDYDDIDECFIEYTPATGTSTPATVVTTTTGC